MRGAACSVALLLACATVPERAAAMQDSARVERVQAERDTSRTPAQQSIYERPFLVSLGRTSIGGYAEANTNHTVQDGLSDGFSMEFRRFNIFLFGAIGRRIRFLSELEFEDGTEEIALETALVDFALNPALVVRAGVILPPIGAFNVNHDSPRWEFIDRPLVSTRIIPATLSEVGLGVQGRLAPGGATLTYDVYVTNGLTDGVVDNAQGRTHIPSGKAGARFAEDNNGAPSLTGRLAVQHLRWGELGLSYYGGAYNAYRIEGQLVDEARSLRLMAVDWAVDLRPVQLRGEVAFARVDIPPGLTEVFGTRQWGGFLDATMPVWRPRMRGLPDAVVQAGVRLERVDFNRGTFSSTGSRIGDELDAVVVGLSFRPAAPTVFKANYRWQRERDLVGNVPSRLARFQLGFATYF